MSRVYFVSDLHIRDSQDNKAQIFLRFLFFLAKQKEPITLVLGGDIFDLWVGDHKYFIKKFEPIVDAISLLIKNRHQVYYFEGNHDLHLKKFWQEKLGVKVHSDPEFFLFDQTVVRFEHGDQMDPEDHGYLFLRWFLRTPVLYFLIMHLPSLLVAKIGNAASKASRNYTDGLRDEDRIRKVVHHHVETVFDEREFNLIIHGHVHLQDEYLFE
ncbi:MAG: UDP-2,3-diacylglucosamine diphosphatase [Bdellovibrionaceae bacterium]|nr:UDP-2,3-diacylglucosamine diphosphatase [Pseudobdellovibrionaceae bacterium]